MTAPQSPPPRPWQPAPRTAAPRHTPQAAADRYLPAMPEMLRGAGGDPPFRAPARVAENSARQGAAPAPVVRAQAPDEPHSSPTLGQPMRRTAGLSIPTPEELGLAGGHSGTARASAPIDWVKARDLLDSWGMRSYSSEKRGNQRRFVCVIADPRHGDRQRSFEAVAGTEEEAIQQVVNQIAAWRGTAAAP